MEMDACEKILIFSDISCMKGRQRLKRLAEIFRVEISPLSWADLLKCV